ncbi:hypothetical protein OZX67_01070 [Bifidobacterium sp. ESL0728]|uniref:DUF6541 family protein n=1 Tax=Bifidobacterium sp. ESL0728 TaxID=2983220 RepID=UPI0023F641B5|nr:DUF6541 family protein [Bifidobacterium sp. ESL0728]WEV59899.1 hypothetical protein OZX67_01070 [Bifidobacterium sp. ESL0728]
MNTKWKQRLGHAALPICSVLGVLAAFGIVVAWFPKTWDAWNLPLQEIDAPAHYYFIRKLLRQGLPAAARLWPNDAYYPPLFHLIAAAIISLGNLLHIKVNIYTAFNLVWLMTSGLVWPAGVSLWASYFTRKVDGKFVEGWRGLESAVHVALGSRKRKGKSEKPWLKDLPSPLGAAVPSKSAFAEAKEKEGNWDEIVDSHSPHWRPFSCAMMLIVPLLAVASASHPFQMLVSGPLIAFGLATSILPFWLYVTLRLLDALADRYHILRWLVLTVLLAVLCVFAHPRIAFTWLLLMAPFMLMRLPWKAILGLLAAVVVCAVAFFFYMIGHYHSSRYFDPSSWFHTYKPNHTVSQALQIFFTDNISGVVSGFMAVVVIVALIVAIAVIFGYIKSKLVIIRFDGRAGGQKAGNVSAGAEDLVRVSADASIAERKTPVATDPKNGGDNDSAVTPDASDTGSSRRHDSVHHSATGYARPSRFATPTPLMAKDAVSLLLAFALVCLVYVCSTSLTGWFPNIVAAAWYRAETRPLTMIPFAIIPLLVFAACSVAYLFDTVDGEPRFGSESSDEHTASGAASSVSETIATVPAPTDASKKPGTSWLRDIDEASIATSERRADAAIPRGSGLHTMASQRSAWTVFVDWCSRNGGKAISVIVLAALAISCQFGNVNRQDLGMMVASNVIMEGKPEDEQLTKAKYDALKETVKVAGNGPVIISDPLNGSMYGSAMFDANMLYPIYNPMHERNGAIFGQTEAAFASGDPAKLTATTCPIQGNVPKYFLAMGPQAPSLQMFTFRQQYDVFHRQDLIDSYVRAGVLHKVIDFGFYGPYAKDWALYSIQCGQSD